MQYGLMPYCTSVFLSAVIRNASAAMGALAVAAFCAYRHHCMWAFADRCLRLFAGVADRRKQG
jgi:hypothetical protein